MFILFVISVVAYKLASENFVLLFALFIIGILLAVSVIKKIKTPENRNYLPYVPALALGAMYFLFI